MAEFKLVSGLHLYPTPSGSYQAVSAPVADKPRLLLQRLLKLEQTPRLTEQLLLTLTDQDEPQKAMEILHHCQKLGWIQGMDQAVEAPSGALETILPGLLGKLSEQGKVLLADEQGFYLSSSGFPHETAEELSALSADLATVHSRRSGLLYNNLGIASHAWAIVDPFGNSQIGFWPIFIGSHRFVIVMDGIPHFNRAEFVTLIWALSKRYTSKIDQ